MCEFMKSEDAAVHTMRNKSNSCAN